VDLTEHLAGARLVEPRPGRHQADRLEEPGDADRVELRGEDRLEPRGRHEGLGGEVVDLVGRDGAEKVERGFFAGEQPKLQSGLIHIFSVGSTAAIGAIEFEPGLQRDLPETLDRLIPPSRDYGHEQAWHDGNGHSHLQATLLGPSLTVPVSGGRLVLGTWQQIFHLECDVRPRERTGSSPGVNPRFIPKSEPRPPHG